MADGNVIVSGESGGSGENKDEGCLSMLDVLQEDQELEEEANAVLGGSDAKYCTYGQGAVGRQALYACTTCIRPDMEPAGVCLACSYDCHEGHDLVEMYTKRNFRCDCGNSRFPNLKCKFFAKKSEVNGCNKYNHNFKGLYCTCQRPYPDPEDDIEDEMIQCVVCEDWYHGRHLGTMAPVNFDYQEMICTTCMQHCDFLWPYAVHSIETKITKEESTAAVNVENETPLNVKQSTENTSTLQSTSQTDCSSQQAKSTEENNDKEKSVCVTETSLTTPKTTTDETQTPNTKPESKPECGESTSENGSQSKDVDVDSKPIDKGDGDDKKAEEKTKTSNSDDTTCTCKLEELKKRDVKERNHSTFWPLGWRKKLCECDKCKRLYEDKGVLFLLDESDTVHHYEQRGKSNQDGGSQYEQGMRAFSGMDRFQQVEVLHGYNDMKSELKDYLKEFAEQGKVVKPEDITEFFETMQARKRQRTDSGPQMQHFCR